MAGPGIQGEPRIKSKVGIVQDCFYDHERTDWSDASPRPLRYTCWYPTDSAEPENMPVAIVCGKNDLEAPHQQCASWLAERLDDCDLTLLGKSVGHYVFLCEPTETGKSMQPDICVDSNDVDRKTIHDETAERAIRFFEQSEHNHGKH